MNAALAQQQAAAAGMFQPRRLGHVVLWTPDPEQTARFYREVVGLEEVYRRAAIAAIFMSNGNTYHDIALFGLKGPRAPSGPGLHHFSLELETEAALVAGYRRTQDAGYKFDYMISADVTNSCYGSDPDGNRFEVYADVKENWRDERSGAVTTGSIPYVPGANPPIDRALYPVDPEIRVVADAAFHPRRCAHAALVARDYAAMLRHYTELAGLRLLAGGADADFAVLGGSLGEETLTLFRSGAGRAPGLHHFGMELADESELDSARERMAARGLQPAATFDHPTRRSLFLRDPNGMLIQFYANRRADYASWSGLSAEQALLVA